jgi:hypothetical protein
MPSIAMYGTTSFNSWLLLMCSKLQKNYETYVVDKFHGVLGGIGSEALPAILYMPSIAMYGTTSFNSWLLLMCSKLQKNYETYVVDKLASGLEDLPEGTGLATWNTPSQPAIAGATLL